MQLQTSKTSSIIISVWLFICLLVVAAIMMVGATTRLIEPGLSIVELQPVNNMLPPDNGEELQKIFEVYKNFPQFHKSFPNMGIDEFRTIYVLEYTRYILEHILIFIYMLPLLLFFIANRLVISDVIKLSAVFLLGNSVNFIHSYMENSLIADEARLIPYFMSLQLSVQFIFFALILWQILVFSYPRQGIGGFELPKPAAPVKVFSCIVLIALFVQIVLGGAASGLHAGLSFNTFPLMDGVWSPVGLWPIPEWYRNLFEDATTAQFVHRIIACALSLLIPLLWLAERNNPHIAHLLPILFSIFVVQFLLGVLTLLFTVPVPIALLHYANSILLFGIAVTIAHRLFIPIKTISYDIVGV